MVTFTNVKDDLYIAGYNNFTYKFSIFVCNQSNFEIISNTSTTDNSNFHDLFLFQNKLFTVDLSTNLKIFEIYFDINQIL